MTEIRHVSPCGSASDLREALGKGQFPVSVVTNQCAVQQNESIAKADKSRPTPALELLGQVCAVAEEHAPRVAFLLHEGVDVTTLAHTSGKLDKLTGPPLEREDQANQVDSLFAHAG